MPKQQVHELQKNYELIRQTHLIDKRLAYVLARSFVGTQKQFDLQQYHALKATLKKKLGFFHSMQPPIMDAVITLMILNDQVTEEAIDQLLANYSLLLEQKFKRNSFTYFSAFLLSLTANSQAAAKRGSTIFQAMRQDHPWLTNSEDSPMAILLALQPYLQKQSPEELAIITEDYYQNLKRAGFSKFSDLQYAAACCTNYFGRYQEEVISTIAKIIKTLRESGFSVNHKVYIAIVTLAYTSFKKKIDFSQIVANERALKETGKLKFDPSTRQLLAISLYTGDSLKQEQATANQLDALNISLMIIQEQAAIITATTVTVIANNSN